MHVETNTITYFKITKYDEVHHELKYHTGLNTDPHDFDENPEHSCCVGGIYFSDREHIEQFYEFGVWIREVKPVGKVVKNGNKYRAHEVVLGERYSLGDPKTWKILNVPSPSMDWVSIKGNIKILNLWKESELEMKYSENEMNWASREGKIEMLNWWKESGCELKYSESAMNWASREDKIEVLNWWKESGLELKYSEDAMYRASYRCNIEVLNWWKDSGLELKKDTFRH